MGDHLKKLKYPVPVINWGYQWGFSTVRLPTGNLNWAKKWGLNGESTNRVSGSTQNSQLFKRQKIYRILQYFTIYYFGFINRYLMFSLAKVSFMYRCTVVKVSIVNRYSVKAEVNMYIIFCLIENFNCNADWRQTGRQAGIHNNYITVSVIHLVISTN